MYTTFKFMFYSLQNNFMYACVCARVSVCTRATDICKVMTMR